MRLVLNLPKQGRTVFFVDNAATVADFKEMVTAEDAKIDAVEILTGAQKAAVADQASQRLVPVLEEAKDPVFLKMNDASLVQFDLRKSAQAQARGEHETQLDLTDKGSKWYAQATAEGIPNLHASAINTITNKVLMEMKIALD